MADPAAPSSSTTTDGLATASSAASQQANSSSRRLSASSILQARASYPHDNHIQRLWGRLQEEEKELKFEKAKIREVWLMIVEAHKKNEEDRKSFQGKGLFEFVEPHSRIVLNVGGQVFETTAQVLCRDPHSILASLCRTKDPPLTPNTRNPPNQPTTTRTFFLDRDWWIFRYILQYLRQGTLPDDPALLHEMYLEATFYRLGLLQKALQERLSRQAGNGHWILDAVMDHGASSKTVTKPQPTTRSRADAGKRLPDPHGFIVGA